MGGLLNGWMGGLQMLITGFGSFDTDKARGEYGFMKIMKQK